MKPKTLRSLIAIMFLLLATGACQEERNLSEARRLIEESINSMEHENFELAIKKADSAMVMYKTLGDSLGIAQASYHLARNSALNGNFKEAIDFGEPAANLAMKFNNWELEYKVNNTLSWAYYMENKSLDETLIHLARQLEVVEKLDDTSKASVYNNYGYDATVAGNTALSEAIEYMEFANDHYSEAENNEGRWYTLMNLTWQYRLINDLAKSQEYGLLSSAQAEVDKDRHAIIEANTNLGETLLLQNKLKEAEPYYKRANDLSNEKLDRDKYVGDVYYSKFLWHSGKKKEAIELAEKAVEFLTTGEIFYEMLGRAYLSEYYFEQGNITLAEEQLQNFNKPRGDFISQESRVIAGIVDAKIRAISNKDDAIQMINSLINEVNVSEATLLSDQLQKVKRSF